MVVWAAIGTSVIILAKTIIEKLTARIKNIPDAKKRRTCTAEEHAAQDTKLDALQTSIDRLDRVTEENATLRSEIVAKDKRITRLTKERDEARAVAVALKDAEHAT